MKLTFGEWLRRILQQNGKSMAWLAKRIGANHSLLTKWRQGNTTPGTEYFLLVVQEISTLQNRTFESVCIEAANVIGVTIGYKGNHEKPKKAIR
tara:strand:+ start:330 stop:611 length:282 start_codon:yes stop_codon:yes gene_type:complete